MIKVRSLKTKDAFDFLGILTKAYGTPEEVRRLFVGFSSNNFAVLSLNIMYGLIQGLIQKAEEEMISWIASLVILEEEGKPSRIVSAEEFQDMPLETILDVAEQLSQREDARSFFERCLKLWQRSQGETPSETSTSQAPSKSGPQPVLISSKPDMDGPTETFEA